MKMCRYLPLNKQRRMLLPVTVLLSLWAQSWGALAQPLDKQNNFSWHGFVSQGYAYTSDNQFLGDSTDGSADFTEAAINGAWDASSDLLLSGQLLYRRAGQAKPMGTRIDYAILDWRLHDQLDAGMGFRLGRLKNPYGFYSETRDVAATRPGVILPEGTYNDYLREVTHSMDSVGFYSRMALATGTFSIEANIGKPIINDETKRAVLNGLPTQGSLSNERALVGRFLYEQNTGVWRTALSAATFSANFDPASGEPFASGEFIADQIMLSFEYNRPNWQFVSEYTWRNIHYNRIFGDDRIYRGIGFYGQLSYFITPQWSVYARKEDVFLDKSDKDGQAFAAESGFTRPAHNAFAKDITYGLRYQPSRNWTLGLEYHRINGTSWLPHIENPDPSQHKRYWEMFLAQVAYRF